MTTHPDPKPMTTKLHTNDEPQRILLEASERIKACYPPGTRVEAFVNGIRVLGGVYYRGFGEFEVFDTRFTRWHRFDPATDPHRVLP